MDLSFLKDEILSDGEKKNILELIKYGYLNDLKLINNHINELQNKIIKECKHVFVTERDYGQYGERWDTCTKCGYLERH